MNQAYKYEAPQEDITIVVSKSRQKCLRLNNAFIYLFIFKFLATF